MAFSVPVGSTLSMSMGVTVSLSEPLGCEWIVSLGGVVTVNGDYEVYPDGDSWAILTDAGQIAALGTFEGFTGCNSATIAMSWTEQRYLTPSGERRGVVGEITATCNGASISWTPEDDSWGYPSAPGLWVTGWGACSAALATDSATSTTLTMNVSQIGLSSFEMFSTLALDVKVPTLFYTSPTISVEGWALGIEITSSADGTTGSTTAYNYPAGGWTSAGMPPNPPYGPDGDVTPGISSSFGPYALLPDYPLLSSIARDTVTVTSEVSTWPAGTPIKGAPLQVWNGAWPGDGEPGQCDNSLDPFEGVPNQTIFAAAPTPSTATGAGPTATLTLTGAPSKLGTEDPVSVPEFSADCVVAGTVGGNVQGEPLTSGGNTFDFFPWPTSPEPVGSPYYLWDNNLDPRAFGNFIDNPANGPGYHAPAIIEMWTSPNLITVTRTTSQVIDNGAAATNWQTVGTGDISPGWDADTAVTLTQVVSGTQFVTTGGGGIGRLLTGSSATLRRTFRLWRWLTININASAAATIRIALFSNFNDNTADPLLAMYWTIDLEEGENELLLDIAQCQPVVVVDGTYANNPGAPAIKANVNGTYGPDLVGDWSLHDYNEFGTLETFVKSANPTIGGVPWQNQDVWWIRLDNLDAGVTYTLSNISLGDRTDGNRTPLRVLGDPCPTGTFAGEDELPLSVGGFGMTGSGGGTIASSMPSYLLRALVNGRPAWGIPWCAAESVEGTMEDVFVDDVISRFSDTIDAGLGAWTLTNLESSLTSIIPASWLQVVPGSVTETGFTLRAVAKYFTVLGRAFGKGTGATQINSQTVTDMPQPAVNPGWNTAVGYQIKAHWNWGNLIEGIAYDAASRTPLSSAAVSSTMLNLPAETGDQVSISVTDDDGYFALNQPQPVVPVGSSFGLVTKAISVNGDMSSDVVGGGSLWYCYDRSILPLIVMLHPVTPSRVANLATKDGSFHRVAQSFYHLSGTAVVGAGGQIPGQSGLSYWRSDAGAPKSWNSYAWTANAIIIDASTVDDYPDIDRRPDGRLYVCFDRQTQASPRMADTWECYSDDDGLTWSMPTMTISGGQYPKLRCGHDGSIYRTAWVDDGSGQGIGTIQGQYQAPGDPSPSTAFPLLKWTGATLVPIVCVGGKYDIEHLLECSSRWIISVLEVGATTPTEYVSADDGGGTFVRQGTPTAGMTIGNGDQEVMSVYAYESTANITLSGVQTVDGVATSNDQVVVLGAQTTASENGPWSVSSTGAWSRPSWYDSGSTQNAGLIYWVAPGGSNGGNWVYATNSATFTVDTTATTWAQPATGGGSASINIQTDVFTVSGGTGASETLTHAPNGNLVQVFFDGVLQPSSFWSYSGTAFIATWASGEGPSTITVTYTY